MKRVKNNLNFRNIPHRDIGIRRAATLSTLSQSLYSLRSMIPPGYQPDKHQLKPLDFLQRAWLGEYLQTNEAGDTPSPRFPRRGVLIADEGGMGKTLSSALVALDALKKGNKAVVIVCPKLLMPQWHKLLSPTRYPVSRLNGERLARGDLAPGVHIMSKHSLAFADLDDDVYDRLDRCISMLILDEAHEGFIRDADQEEHQYNDRLGTSLRSLSRVSDQCVLATATPIRNGAEDLSRLLTLIDPEWEAQLLQFNDAVRFDDAGWMNALGEEWLPRTEAFVDEQGATQENLDWIIQSLDRFVPLPEPQREELRLRLAAQSEELFASTRMRFELAQDLHPLGRFLCATLRDDLGQHTCDELYRGMTVQSERYPPNNDYVRLKTLLETAESPSQWKPLLRSCPLNLLKSKRYKTARHLENHPQTADIRQLAERAWTNDARLAALRQKIEGLKQADIPSKGLVIFTRYRGTIEALSKALRDIDGTKTYTFIPPNSDFQGKGEDQRPRNLRVARRASLEHNQIPILLCGDSGAVGLNMEWASDIIHWDLISSVAILSQKTWRLDRRMAPGHGFVNFFSVTNYFHDVEDLEKKLDSMNDNNRQFRLLLGDRRYFGNNGPDFIPLPGAVIERAWTDNERFFSFSSPLCSSLWDFIIGVIDDAVSVYAESIGLDALFHPVGVDFTGAWAADGVFSGFEPPLPEDGPQIDRSEIHLLCTLTPNPNELQALKSLAGGYRNPIELIPQSGRAMMRSSSVKLLPAPDGDLSRYFFNRLKNLHQEFTHYPFLIAQDYAHQNFESPQVMPGNGSLRYAANCAVLDLKATRYFSTLKRIVGDHLPSGLMVCRGEGPWQHILEAELDLHREVFSLMARTAKQDLRIIGGFDTSREQLIGDTLAMEQLEPPITACDLDPTKNEDLLRKGGIELMDHFFKIKDETPELLEQDSVDLLPLIIIGDFSDDQPEADQATEGQSSQNDENFTHWDEFNEYGWC